MNLKAIFFTLFFFPAAASFAQTNAVTLNIGDPAPPIKVRKWIKGTPVDQFEKGKVYVVEFWATWCQPCIAGMPHLSRLAGEYKNKVTVAGISILERTKTTPAQIDSFVYSMGTKMNYNVAAEESNYMAATWLQASGERGIPFAYIVDQERTIAWMGHPKKLDDVLPKVVDRSWNLSTAITERKEQQMIRSLDNTAWERLNKFMGNPGKPDSALLEVEKMIREEPKLKYAPRIGHYTFWSLIKTDPKKAAVYGRDLMKAESYDDPPYKSITDAVGNMVEMQKIELPKEVYEVGAEAYQAQIDNYPWSMNLPLTYGKIAELYYRSGNKSSAIKAQEKAIEAANNQKDFPAAEMNAMMEKMRNYLEM